MIRKIIIQNILPKNFSIVDKTISRSAQPTIKNLKWFKEQGYTDIINFRTMIANEVTFDEENIVNQLGMKYHWLPSITREPNDLNVKKFFNIIKRVKNRGGKVLIHCKAGADRTGMYVFLYKTKNHIDNMQNNIKEWIEKGHDYLYFPHLIDWATDCAKRLF